MGVSEGFRQDSREFQKSFQAGFRGDLRGIMAYQGISEGVLGVFEVIQESFRGVSVAIQGDPWDFRKHQEIS